MAFLSIEGAKYTWKAQDQAWERGQKREHLQDTVGSNRMKSRPSIWGTSGKTQSPVLMVQTN